MSDLIDRAEAVMALRLEYPMMPLFKSLREEWAIKAEGYRKAEEVIMSIPSARPTNRGICGVCAGKDVCGRNNRNLDMMECNIFELDRHYKIAHARPKGEWVEVTNGRGGHECSVCHGYAPSYQSGDEHLSSFCPNCGARMKGADDE